MDIRSIHRGQTIEWEGKQRLCVYAWDDHNDGMGSARTTVFSDGLVLTGSTFVGDNAYDIEQAFADETLATGD